MDRTKFIQMITKDFEAIVEINKTKGADYAGEDDAVLNFKRGAMQSGARATPEQIWWVYANKHWDAITTYCWDGSVKSEAIEGRLHDMILYCFLQLALVRERSPAAVGIAGGTPEELEMALIKAVQG